MSIALVIVRRRRCSERLAEARLTNVLTMLGPSQVLRMRFAMAPDDRPPRVHPLIGGRRASASLRTAISPPFAQGDTLRAIVTSRIHHRFDACTVIKGGMSS